MTPKEAMQTCMEELVGIVRDSSFTPTERTKAADCVNDIVQTLFYWEKDAALVVAESKHIAEGY